MLSSTLGSLCAGTRLQVIGELRAAGVSWVHGDKHRAGWHKWDLDTFKHEAFHLQGKGLAHLPLLWMGPLVPVDALFWL